MFPNSYEYNFLAPKNPRIETDLGIPYTAFKSTLSGSGNQQKDSVKWWDRHKNLNDSKTNKLEGKGLETAGDGLYTAGRIKQKSRIHTTLHREKERHRHHQYQRKQAEKVRNKNPQVAKKITLGLVDAT